MIHPERPTDFTPRFEVSSCFLEHDGKFLVLDIESGDYEIGDDEMEASRRSRAKHPDGIRYLLRIGYRAAASLGGASRRNGS